MAKVTSGYFNDVDAPELRFEEAQMATASAKRAANHGVAVAAPIYGVEDDRYSELNDKKANMLRLQQELEKTQREARELELRRAKEERFGQGRREICERLARSLAKLDRELYNAQKAVEEISSARECYHHHLDTLRGLQPDPERGDDEMDRAIGAVEDAEDEFSKTSRRLATALPQLGIEGFVHSSSAPQGFVSWLRAGAAFSIPLAAAAVLVALILKLLP
jgi:DNA repair exonuclease SbcCD ATPase subunit